MDENKIKTDFEKILNPFSAVVSIYLFGSTATDFDRKNSDVDIAIHLDESESATMANELRFQLLDLFEGYFNRPVDVVILNNASLKLIHQVLKHGVLIYTRGTERTRAFALRKRKEYFDFKYYIDQDIKQMRSFFLDSEQRG